MIRPIAIHLPQFHPIPENNIWWGKGFTEWTNVAKAKPLFRDHNQPHFPADLGYYDLRLPEARLAQEQLAKEYGIYGFCYYHYWFHGKRLLNEVVDRKLKNDVEDLPFMLCWANENWTRRWDGNDSEILIKQEYSLKDHLEHALFLCENFFSDNRYIKVDGKPVFIFYKSYLIPDFEKVVNLWREAVLTKGFKGIYLLCIDNFVDKPAEQYDLDGAIHFHPDYRYFQTISISLKERLLHKLGINSNYKMLHHVEDYIAYARKLKQMNFIKSNKLYPGATPMWDNTARKAKDGIIFLNSSPENYYTALKDAISDFKPYSAEEDFLFINAWNEWGEGNHLEPCLKYGHAYLEMTQKAILEYNTINQ